MIIFLSLLLTIAPLESHFGKLWKQIQRLESSKLDQMIQERLQEIAEQKEHWRGILKQTEELKKTLSSGTLSPAPMGCGAAYILYDKNGDPVFIIKPVDEESLCLNNRKAFASPYNTRAFRIRDEIPLYRSAQTEVLSCAMAELLGLGRLIPETTLAIISSPSFYNITEGGDKEKLCSVQRFFSHEKTLLDLIQEDEKITLDQREFEELMLLMWCIYDTDGHADNFPAVKDSRGIYHLKKIDSGLAFPDKNRGFFNTLYFIPHAREKISPELRGKIAKLPLEKMEELICYFEMDACHAAFKERVQLLQKLAAGSDLTLAEIDMRLRRLQE